MFKIGDRVKVMAFGHPLNSCSGVIKDIKYCTCGRTCPGMIGIDFYGIHSEPECFGYPNYFALKKEQVKFDKYKSRLLS